MIQTIITAAILYIIAIVDLLVILLIFFARAQTKKEYRDICIGRYVGSATLIVVSLFFAFVLNYVPERQILGLLGFIPIYLGLEVAIFGDHEGEKRAKQELDKHGLTKLIGTVVLVIIVGCGTDGIGLFVPYFVTLSVSELVVTLVVFLVLTYVLVFTAQKLVSIPEVGETVEEFNHWIVTVVYIGLGLFIIIENHTLQTIRGILF